VNTGLAVQEGLRVTRMADSRLDSQPDNFLSNADIAKKLASLAQLLAAQKANKYKVKAYRRAANTISALSESVEDLVRSNEDLTKYPGIGEAISGAIREIVLTGGSRQLESLRQSVTPEVAAISEYPKLDPRRVLRIFKKLNIATVSELKENLESGEIAAALGPRMAEHVRQAISESHEVLLYTADNMVPAVKKFLLEKCKVKRAELTGIVRRRVEVIDEISFLLQTDAFAGVIAKLERYGGRTELLSADDQTAEFKLASGVRLKIVHAAPRKWGLNLIVTTGSDEHVRRLNADGRVYRLATSKDNYPTEESVYNKLDMAFIVPELREGNDEVELALRRQLPTLVSINDIRGDLHAHTISSDGINTIEEMVAAVSRKGYDYVGISDHSQSLKIANGLSQEELWNQIRRIDELNEKSEGIRILKSAEVDILSDGSLDYPDELLKELDYTVCSIHSRFGLGRAEQTNRLRRAMENRYFTILGHATGRLLLKRPGYELDMEQVIEHARQVGCFFEINSSPDRLDLSATNAHLVSDAGLKIAINTDAHSVQEFDYIQYGVDQARRAGFEKSGVLNCMSLRALERLFKR
jgi:DNA polymerase (family X)